MDSKTEPAGGFAVADDLLLGCKEIAAEIGISPHAAWRLIRRGAIPARKLGPHLWCASRRELRKHFSAQRVE